MPRTTADPDKIMETANPKTPGPKTADGTRPRVHLDFLDGLRGLAAAYVVCFHFLALGATGLPRWAAYAVSWANFGHSAVNVFIVLSGFSLMLPVARSEDKHLRGGTRHYLFRRAWRILPPYYAALALSLLALLTLPQRMTALHEHLGTGQSPDFSTGSLLSHLAVLHNLSPDWSGRINMALWSVATEWQIYFLFPLLLLPVWRRFGGAAAVAAGFTAGLLPLVINRYDLSVACFWYIGLFALGMTGAVSYARSLWPQEGDPARRAFPSNMKLLGLTVLLMLCYLAVLKILPAHSQARVGYLRFYIAETLKDGITGGLTVCLILYCARGVSLRREGARAPRVLLLLESPAARALGLFSYSLYLTHCIVLQKAESVTAALHFSPLNSLSFRAFVGIPVALGFAYLFHKVAEKPFMTPFQKQSENVLKTPLHSA